VRDPIRPRLSSASARPRGRPAPPLRSRRWRAPAPGFRRRCRQMKAPRALRPTRWWIGSA